MMKVYVFVVVFLLSLLLGSGVGSYGFAQESLAELSAIHSLQDASSLPQIWMYGKATCPHCAAAKKFLTEQESGSFVLNYVDVQEDEDALKEFVILSQKAELPKTVPLFFINGKVFQGFVDGDTSGKKLLEELEQTRSIAEEDRISPQDIVLGKKNLDEGKMLGECKANDPEACKVEAQNLVDLPWFGTIDLAKTGLALGSIVLGFVDGFNPCAMWVLIIFLTALIEFGDRKKMFQVAGIFILAEAIMYYMILNVWMYTWDFVGLDQYVTPVVGFVATAAGLYFLYEWKCGDGTCKVGSFEKKRKTHQKIKHIASQPMTILVFFAILGLALSVNIIEFACSIGIPQTFTKILDMSHYGFLAKQFFNFLYILFYMVDDLIVFAIAIYSFDKIGITTKYTKLSHLIGGILMLLLGIIMIVQPSLLVW